MIAALLSALHVLALGIGLGAVFARGRFLRGLAAGPDPRILDGLFRADNLWGTAAALWLLTGLARAFGHVEKAPEFYLRNGFFWLKMGLFASVFALEIWPMVTFIRWRRQRGRGEMPDTSSARRLYAMSHMEMALVVAIVFVAAFMARGY